VATAALIDDSNSNSSSGGGDENLLCISFVVTIALNVLNRTALYKSTFTYLLTYLLTYDEKSFSFVLLVLFERE